MERLRGLHPPQGVAVGRVGHDAVVLRGKAVDHWQHRDGCLLNVERGEQAGDDGGGQHRPRGIVDQHASGAAAASASSPSRTDCCRLAPPVTRRIPAMPASAAAAIVVGALGDGHDDRRNACICQRLGRMPDDRFAAPAGELLGQRLASPQPRPAATISPAAIGALRSGEGHRRA